MVKSEWKLLHCYRYVCVQKLICKKNLQIQGEKKSSYFQKKVNRCNFATLQFEIDGLHSRFPDFVHSVSRSHIAHIVGHTKGFSIEE